MNRRMVSNGHLILSIYFCIQLSCSGLSDNGNPVVVEIPQDYFDENINEIFPDEKPNTTTPPPVPPTDCGGVLVGLTGRIEYKNGIPFKNNERCTWTIHAPSAATINFTVEQNGLIQSKEDYLIVGYFLDSDYKTLENFNEIILSHNSVNKTVSVPGPVALLRFYSDNTINGLGFIVTYTARTSNVSLPFKFKNYYFDAPYGTIDYPENGGFYSHLERVIFSFRPTASGYLALKYFDGNCEVEKDFLTIYRRYKDPYYGQQQALSVVRQFCNSSVTLVPNWSIKLTDEYLITFHSSISGRNRGFQFIWTAEYS